MASRGHLTKVHDSCHHDQGMGTTASEFIPKGARIYAEIPIYYAKFALIVRPQSAEEEKWIVNEMRKLPTHAYNNLMKMRNQLPQCLDSATGTYVLTPVSGTIRSNFIPFALGRYQARADELGVFLRMSKINHSCRPNATQTWNHELEEETIYAIEDIPVGEAITISYSPEARIDPTWVGKTYGFSCSCKWCLMDDTPAKKASEVNRADIEALGVEFESIEDPEKALMCCYHRVGLIQKEGVCDWRKGLAFEDALDLMTEEFKDKERGKLLAILSFLAYWKCQGWDTAKGTDLGGKLARLYDGMNPDKGKAYLFELVERYVKDQDGGLIEHQDQQRGRTVGGDNGEGTSARREDHVMGSVEAQAPSAREKPSGSSHLEDGSVEGQEVTMRGGGPPSRGKKTPDIGSALWSEGGDKKLRRLLSKPHTSTLMQSNVTHGQHPLGLTNFSRLRDGAGERQDATMGGGVQPYQEATTALINNPQSNNGEDLGPKLTAFEPKPSMPILAHPLPPKPPMPTPTQTTTEPEARAGENGMVSSSRLEDGLEGVEKVMSGAVGANQVNIPGLGQLGSTFGEHQGEMSTDTSAPTPALQTIDSDIARKEMSGDTYRGEVSPAQGEEVIDRVSLVSSQDMSQLNQGALKSQDRARGKTKGPAKSTPTKNASRVKSLSGLLPRPRQSKPTPTKPLDHQPTLTRPLVAQTSGTRLSATQLFTPTPSGPQPFAVQPPPPGNMVTTPGKKRSRPRKNTDSTVSEPPSPPRNNRRDPPTPSQARNRVRSKSPSPDDDLADMFANIRAQKQKTGKSPAKSPAGKVTKPKKSPAKSPAKVRQPRAIESPFSLENSTPAVQYPVQYPADSQPEAVKKPAFDTEKVWEQLNAPLVRPDGAVEMENGGDMMNYSSILKWLFMVKEN